MTTPDPIRRTITLHLTPAKHRRTHDSLYTTTTTITDANVAHLRRCYRADRDSTASPTIARLATLAIFGIRWDHHAKGGAK